MKVGKKYKIYHTYKGLMEVEVCYVYDDEISVKELNEKRTAWFLSKKFITRFEEIE